MRLIRHGFTDPDTAEQLLTGLDGGAEEAVLVALSDTADPDLALSALSRIVAALARPIACCCSMHSALTMRCVAGWASSG